MRSSRPHKARAQDDGLKNSFDGIYRIDCHATFVATDENYKPRFDMPWHVATLIEHNLL